MVEIERNNGKLPKKYRLQTLLKNAWAVFVSVSTYSSMTVFNLFAYGSNMYLGWGLHAIEWSTWLWPPLTFSIHPHSNQWICFVFELPCFLHLHLCRDHVYTWILKYSWILDEHDRTLLEKCFIYRKKVKRKKNTQRKQCIVFNGFFLPCIDRHTFHFHSHSGFVFLSMRSSPMLIEGLGCVTE